MNDRPHIIYILSDEHSGFAVGHHGDPNVRTPHIDQLAAEGVSLARAYSNCPICTPSRGSIFSGRHAHAGPVQGFFDVYKATSPSTATLLRAAGYHTAYFGKWHCGVVRDQVPAEAKANPKEYSEWPQRTPEHHRGGFQDWNAFEVNNAPFRSRYFHDNELAPRLMPKYQSDSLTDMAIEYLENYQGDEPLFLVLSIEPPHFPLEAPSEWCRFDPATLKVRPNFGDGANLREQLATYYAMIENLDDNIGRLRVALDSEARFKDQTLTVYFSDHGDFMGSHNAINRKEQPYEESVRIPAVFHWPGHIAPQAPRPELFGLVDLLPTTLGLAEVPIPAHIQGIDFSPALRGEAFSGPESVLIEMVGSPRWSLDFPDWRGVVTRRWKYAFYETGHELLFDTENDPFEMHDLSESMPDVKQEMRERLLELLASTREPYFDVLMEHGAPLQQPVRNISTLRHAHISPYWDDMIEDCSS